MVKVGKLTGGLADAGGALKKVDFGSLGALKKVDLGALKKVDLGDLKKVDLGGVSKVGKKVDLGGAAKTTKKVAKKTGKKLAKLATENPKAVFGVAAAGAGVGALAYVENKLEKESKNTQKCAALCLPENWDEYEGAGLGGKLKKNQLKYSTLDDVKADNDGELPKKIGGESWDDQPFCKDTIEDFADYCTKSCKSLHKEKLPGGALVNKAADAVTGAANDLAKKLGLDEFGKYIKWGAITIGIVILLAIIFKIVSFVKPKSA